MKKLRQITFFVLTAAAGQAQAQLSLEITGAGANLLPVTIADFAGDATARVVANTVRSDLARSGAFRLIDPAATVISESAQVNLGDWKARGADALVGGSLQRSPDGRMEARFRLYDTQRQAAIGGEAYLTGADQLRAAGHRIADYVYEKLTGEKGIFSTLVACVPKSGGQYRLQIADSDGQNAATALSSP